MPEQPPLPESEFSPDEIEIIEALKMHGIEDSDTMNRFITWVSEQERSADAAGIPRANIECNLKIARVQHAAGFAEAARDSLESVRQMANQEGEIDLLMQADGLLDEIDAERK